MTAPQTSRSGARSNFNHLRRGTIYQATTRHGTTVGEYLGMEASYGDRAILLRNGAGTESIYHDEVTSILPAVAA